MHMTKIATCCYCGTRAALVFDKNLHELSCSTCAAPLHNMKCLPERQPVSPVSRGLANSSAKNRQERPSKPPKKQRKKRKSKKKFEIFNHKAIGKIWDVVEDIFD